MRKQKHHPAGTVTAARQSNLELVSSMNKEEILYYISQAKIQIYSHYMIAYDPTTFTSFNKNGQIVKRQVEDQQNMDIVKATSNRFKVNHAKASKLIQKQSKKNQEIKAKQNELKTSQKMNKLYTSASTYHNSELVLEQLAQISQAKPQEKVLFFNDPNVAFLVVENKSTIQIYNLANHQIQLKFSISNFQEFTTVHTLFRKKLCELGFQKKYKKIKLLGKGATAEVFLVQRISDKKQFAAKIIKIQQTQQKQHQLFVNEAKLLRSFSHKNIISLESLYIHNKQLIQLLEYLPGGTLLEYLKKANPAMTLNQKWRALQHITLALQYLRKRRIAHRDLKLENIMIRHSATPEYVVSDFGLACWVGQNNPVYEKCGTPGYIAPEILNLPPQVNIIDHKCDIFSLGVIAHLLFLHEPVFHYKGNLKDLIQQNKLAKINFKQKKYTRLRSQQLSILTMSLQLNANKRASSQQLLKIINPMVIQVPQKSVQRSSRRYSLESQNFNVETKVKREASLTKKSIKIDLKSIQETSFRQKQQKKSPKRSFFSSARKTVSNIWQGVFSPSNGPNGHSERMKLKQNSVQKYSKMKQFSND